MTSNEIKFALEIEKRLTTLKDSEYRQMMVECICVLHNVIHVQLERVDLQLHNREPSGGSVGRPSRSVSTSSDGGGIGIGVGSGNERNRWPGDAFPNLERRMSEDVVSETGLTSPPSECASVFVSPPSQSVAPSVVVSPPSQTATTSGASIASNTTTGGGGGSGSGSGSGGAADGVNCGGSGGGGGVGKYETARRLVRDRLKTFKEIDIDWLLKRANELFVQEQVLRSIVAALLYC